MPSIPTGGSTGVYSDSGMYSAEPPAAASALAGPTILPTEIPDADEVVDAYSADLLFDERLVLLPSFDATQPPLVVLTGDKISDSAASTGVIATSAFVFDSSQLTPGMTYGFEEKSALDPAVFASIIDDGAALSGSVSINALQLISVATDPGEVPTTKYVDIYYTAGPQPPAFSTSTVTLTPGFDRYNIPYNPFSYNGFAGPFENKALTSKYGYDAITYNEFPYEGTLERLDEAMLQIIDDLEKGVMQRLDLSKTTRKIEFTRELVESITGDELLEQFTPTTDSPSTTTVTTSTTSTPRSGGTY